MEGAFQKQGVYRVQKPVGDKIRNIPELVSPQRLGGAQAATAPIPEGGPEATAEVKGTWWD